MCNAQVCVPYTYETGTEKATPSQPLTCGDRVISVELGQYHGCWCPGSLRRQDISSHDIDHVEYVAPGLTRGKILSTCVISMWSNNIKCKYMFMFPLKNSARKELNNGLIWTLDITSFSFELSKMLSVHSVWFETDCLWANITRLARESLIR